MTRRFWFILLLAAGLSVACSSSVVDEPPASSEATQTRPVTPTVPATHTPVPTPVPPATATTPPESPAGVDDGNGSNMADADVLFVRAAQAENGTWTFHVTVEHPDNGWENYTDGWDVVTPEGTVIRPDPGSPFTRLLLHPHDNEQPFTRSQSGIKLPAGVTTVTVRAHDLVDGFGGQEVLVDLSVAEGENFTVETPIGE